MDEARDLSKDQGISDVLESEDKYYRNGNKHEDEQNPDVDRSQTGNENSEQMHQEPHVYSKNQTDEEKYEESNDKPSELGQDYQANGNDEAELDLSDPASVIHMLETVDLTEEDTESLLQEAYNMNRKLKEMLRRQEMGSSDSSSSGSSKSEKGQKKSKNKSSSQKKENGSLSKSAQSSETNSRVGSSFGSRKILPPITNEKEKSVYAIKFQRSRTNIPDTRPTITEHKLSRSKSSKDAIRLDDSSSPTRRRKAKQDPKPEWNDRFNYT